MKTINILKLLGAALGIASVSVSAQTVTAPFASDYTVTNLGSVPGVPPAYGGAILEAGSPNTLLIGGGANGANGGIYAVDVTRNAQNHITGFVGSATLFSTAPYIDGGLAYAPNGDLFYTGYPTNQIGEIKPGSTSPDKIVALTPLGIQSSVGGLQFIPAGQPGAGKFVVASYSGGEWYQETITPDGSGTYDIGTAGPSVQIGGGPEGIAYVPGGSPGFSNPTVLVADYSLGKIEAYSVDANGDPILATAQDFITGLSGAEGAFIDPLTGDYFFSTYGGGNNFIEVSGFTQPVQAGVPDTARTLLMLGLALAALVGFRRLAPQAV